MKSQETIKIKGAAQNNLKGISLEIPKNKITVITGVSGSGKSSLAFDTIYAEGYRRYVENLSSSARFFLGAVKKPKVDRIENLSPAIAIDQKSDSSNPRSTVGTLTDVYHFFRLLYAQLGQPFCPTCRQPLQRQSVEDVVRILKEKKNGTQVLVLADWRKKQKTFGEKINAIASLGYSKIRIRDKNYPIDQAKQLKFKNREKIQVIVDRLILLTGRFDRERIVDSIQSAARLSGGKATILVDQEEKLFFSQDHRCPRCDFSLQPLSAKNFSFNSPQGACEKCSGLGMIFRADLKKIIPNRRLSLDEGALLPWLRSGGKINGYSREREILKALARKHGFKLDVPVNKIPREKLEKIIYGEKDSALTIKTSKGLKEEFIFSGLAGELEDRYRNSDSSFVRAEAVKYLTREICPECQGKRLKKEFLHVRFLNQSIDQVVSLEVSALLKKLKDYRQENLGLEGGEKKIIQEVSKEIINRLSPIDDIGLGYLDLNRSVQTLSGGEFQRVRLATQLYSGLSDVIYVLDEPSVGLHPRDTGKLIKTLKNLCLNGNTVLVVEHDRDIIEEADWIVDIGPKAGEEGGQVIFSGTIKELKKQKTITAQHLRGERGDQKNKKRAGSDFLEIKGARHNNLKNLDVKIPLGKLVSVVGVSGGGKSSLISDVLAPALRKKFHKSLDEPGKHRQIKGVEKLDKVIIVDQGSIGRSTRSNAATYTRLFGYVRRLFADTEMARKKKLTAKHFSFNMRGGRCEYCQGEGVRKIEMHLLQNIYADCPHCNGTRYSKKIIPVQYHGANIVEVLKMSVDYAYHFFSSHRLIRRKLSALRKVGLGYLRLGQSATELSGGEAQRIKLATELARKSSGQTVYILDEPTVGLHCSDVERLLKVLQNLVEKGNSVVVIEHNMDVIKNSDWVIELGPEGGKAGGYLIFEGKPEQLKKAKTETGKAMDKD